MKSVVVRDKHGDIVIKVSQDREDNFEIMYPREYEWTVHIRDDNFNKVNLYKPIDKPGAGKVK